MWISYSVEQKIRNHIAKNSTQICKQTNKDAYCLIEQTFCTSFTKQID